MKDFNGTRDLGLYITKKNPRFIKLKLICKLDDLPVLYLSDYLSALEKKALDLSFGKVLDGRSPGAGSHNFIWQ